MDNTGLNGHQLTPIKDVKNGDYFRMKVNGPVYVRSNYDPSQRKFEAHKWDDINHFIYKRRDFPVYVGFEF